MYEVALYAICGMVGGLIRAIITGEGILVLPRIHEGRVDLGFISALIIGAFAGWIAPYGLGVDSIVAGMAGYCGIDFIENAVERRIKRRGETT